MAAKSLKGVSSPVYAGFTSRAAAFIIDSLLVSIVLGILLGLFGVQYNEDNNYASLALLVYSFIATSLYGKTIGKRIFNLRVVGPKKKVSWGKAFVREVIGKIISSVALSIGFLWVIWDKEKQGWHDKLAKTHVVLEAPLNKVQRIICYLLIVGLPVLLLIGIIAAMIIAAMDPLSQVERARELQNR